MRRLLALLLFLALAIPVGMGSVAHAMEPVACLDMQEASQLGHAIGDADETPGDAGKAYPHHHAGCAGHVVAIPASGSTPPAPRRLEALAPPALAPALAAAASEAPRRPPRA